MTLGPLEYTVIGFEGNRFDGSIADELQRVVESGVIAPRRRRLRLQGRRRRTSTVIELDNKDDARFAGFAPCRGRPRGLLTAEDIGHLARQAAVNTSALVVLFEHRWAVHVKRAIIDAGGFLVSRETHRARGPGDVQRRARGEPA